MPVLGLRTNNVQRDNPSIDGRRIGTCAVKDLLMLQRFAPARFSTRYYFLGNAETGLPQLFIA